MIEIKIQNPPLGKVRFDVYTDGRHLFGGFARDNSDALRIVDTHLADALTEEDAGA